MKLASVCRSVGLSVRLSVGLSVCLQLAQNGTFRRVVTIAC